MLLASVDTIRDSLGFDSGTDINNAIEENLQAAEPYIAARLNIPGFDRRTRTDKFFVSEPLLLQNGFGYTQFRLKMGFLTGVPTLAEWSHTPNAWPAGGDILSNIEVDLEKGIISDVVTLYNKMFVQVTYEGGFLPVMQAGPNPGDPAVATKKWADVPEWLQQAARLQTIIGLQNHPSIKEAKIDLDIKGLKRQFEITLANHLRYAPTAVMPL